LVLLQLQLVQPFRRLCNILLATLENLDLDERRRGEVVQGGEVVREIGQGDMGDRLREIEWNDMGDRVRAIG
jgi:hypothetical protein